MKNEAAIVRILVVCHIFLASLSASQKASESRQHFERWACMVGLRVRSGQVRIRNFWCNSGSARPCIECVCTVF